jgi:hypothetical protein
LSDDTYLSKGVDDKKSLSTWIEVLNLFYHQPFFTTNSLGH